MSYIHNLFLALVTPSQSTSQAAETKTVEQTGETQAAEKTIDKLSKAESVKLYD